MHMQSTVSQAMCHPFSLSHEIVLPWCIRDVSTHTMYILSNATQNRLSYLGQNLQHPLGSQSTVSAASRPPGINKKTAGKRIQAKWLQTTPKFDVLDPVIVGSPKKPRITIWMVGGWVWSPLHLGRILQHDFQPHPAKHRGLVSTVRIKMTYQDIPFNDDIPTCDYHIYFLWKGQYLPIGWA